MNVRASVLILLILSIAFSTCPCQAKAAMHVQEIQRISCNYANVTCSEANVTELDYSSYHGGYVEIERPSYLEGAEEDCDLFFKSKAITTDLRKKQQMLDVFENRLDSAEDEADDLLRNGNHTLSLIQTVQHQYTFTTSYPSVHQTHTIIGGAYSMGGMDSQMIEKIENVYEALENVEAAWSHANASLQELREVEEGLDEFCTEGKCMFPEQKDYYGELMAARHEDVYYYTAKTEDFIEDARDFIDDYHSERASLNCSGKLRMPLGEVLRVENGFMFIGNSTAPSGPMDIRGMKVMPHGKGFMLNDSGAVAKGNMSLRYANGTLMAGKRPLKVPPSQVASRYMIKEMEIIDEDDPKYAVRYRKHGKLLGLIPVEMEVEAEISAEDGEVISEEKPFWSFFVMD